MEKMEQSKLKEFTCLFSEKIENRLGLCCEQKKDGDRLESKRNCKDSECYLWSAHNTGMGRGYSQREQVTLANITLTAAVLMVNTRQSSSSHNRLVGNYTTGSDPTKQHNDQQWNSADHHRLSSSVAFVTVTQAQHILCTSNSTQIICGDFLQRRNRMQCIRGFSSWNNVAWLFCGWFRFFLGIHHVTCTTTNETREQVFPLVVVRHATLSSIVGIQMKKDKTAT